MLDLRREIERRHADALAPVGLADEPEELAPVVRAINRLMARVEAALAAERSFTANSAHELRTPIAGALAHLQCLIAEAPEGPLRERARHAQAGLRRPADLSGKLVELAHAEAGLPARRKR